jgi:hypothetical protein
MEMEGSTGSRRWPSLFYIIIGSFRGQTWIVEDEVTGHQCHFLTMDRADSYIEKHQDVWDKETKYTVHGIK